MASEKVLIAHQEVVTKLLQDYYGITVLDMTSNVTTTTEFCAKVTGKVTRSGQVEQFTCKVVDGDGVKTFGVVDVAGPTVQTKALYHLLDSGLLCCKPVPTLDGKPFCDRINSAQLPNKVLQVYEYLPGTSLNKASLTLHLYDQLGEWLAHIQVALNDMPHGDCGNLKWTVDRVCCSGSLSELPLGELESDHQCRIAKDILTQWNSVLPPAVQQFGYNLIHGDPHLANIIGIEGKEDGDIKEKFALIDFESIRYHVSMYPLGSAMRTNGFLFVPSGLDPESVWEHMLRGYTKILPLPKEELTMVYYVVCVSTLSLTLYFYLQTKRVAQDLFHKYVGDDGKAIARKLWAHLEFLWLQGPEATVNKWLQMIHKEVGVN